MSTKQPTQDITVILPKDVDDPNGYGAKQALEVAGIDRDERPELADHIEAVWWGIYRDCALDALAAVRVRRVAAPDAWIGTPELSEVERAHPDAVALGDVVDMVAVAHAAEIRFAAWWAENAEQLVEQHRPNWGLYEADTGERIGEATDAQAEASAAAGAEGIILVDADGDVIAPGTWAASRPGARKVYVA